MNRLFAALLLATAWLDAHAQSSLPPCPMPVSTATWANCFGTVTFANGSKYVGGYRNGVFHGQGTYAYAEGSKYVGEFRDGKYHGQGTLYNVNGTVQESGMWRDNQLLQSFAIDTARAPPQR